jgi:hypothetical protein
MLDHCIKRKRFFDILKPRFLEVSSSSFIHPIDKLSKVVSRKSNCCSDSWAIATVSCLSDLYGLRDGTNPDLDYSFIMSCYAPRNFSKYFTTWGCNGDSIYNAIYFLYINGTIPNNCWDSVIESESCVGPGNPQTCSRASIKCQNPLLYKLGESELPGKNPDAFNISPILTNDNKLIWPGANGPFEISPEKAFGYMRYIIEKGPVVTCFPIQKQFIDGFGTNWDPVTGIYTPDNSPIVASHCAVIVGWGPGYWVLRNSWGTEWGPRYKDIPPGYWKHATFQSSRAIGSVDISVAPDVLGTSGDPIGMVVSLGISSSVEEQSVLDISKLSYAPYIRGNQDIYPKYLWITLFIVIVLLSAKIFI